MKCRVLKEYAGIEPGTIVTISEKDIKYMVKKGYVEPLEELNPIEPIKGKAIESDYKTKVIEPTKNKGGRHKTKK